MTPRIIVDATAEPLTYDEIVAQSRTSYGQERALVEAYISSARASCENYINGTISPKTLEIGLDAFASRWGQQWAYDPWNARYVVTSAGCLIELPLGPVQSIVSIAYIDLDGVDQVVADTVFVLDQYRNPQALHLAYGQTWPSTRSQTNAIKVRYVAGYAFNDSPPKLVPPPILHAIRLQVVHMMENRAAVDMNNLSELDLGVKYLLDPYKREMGV